MYRSVTPSLFASILFLPLGRGNEPASRIRANWSPPDSSPETRRTPKASPISRRLCHCDTAAGRGTGTGIPFSVFAAATEGHASRHAAASRPWLWRTYNCDRGAQRLSSSKLQCVNIEPTLGFVDVKFTFSAILKFGFLQSRKFEIIGIRLGKLAGGTRQHRRRRSRSRHSVSLGELLDGEFATDGEEP